MQRLLLLGAFALAGSLVFAQGTITELRGKVEIQLPGQTQWQAATQGMRVPLNAILSTGFNSSASIRVNASTVRLRAMTRVALETLTTQNGMETTDLRLNVGRVNAEVRRTEASEIRFTVRSPQATASVRGTDFDMDMFRLHVDAGLVDYDLGQGAQSIPGGSYSLVAGLGEVTPAQDSLDEKFLLRFGPNRLRRLREIGWRPDAGFGGSSKIKVIID